LPQAQTRVSVPHRLCRHQHLFEYGRIDVAQTLLSVLVLGTTEQIKTGSLMTNHFASFTSSLAISCFASSATVTMNCWSLNPGAEMWIV